MNITLSANEELIKKARKYAMEHDTTLNQLIRDYLTQLVMMGNTQEAADRFLRVCDSTAGDSGGWKWNRSEIYEE